MSKNIFDEAKETLLGVGTTFIAVPCNPIGQENSDMIHLRDSTEEYGGEMSKVVKALELGKLYKEFFDELKSNIIKFAVGDYESSEYLDFETDDPNKCIEIFKKIKELENDKI